MTDRTPPAATGRRPRRRPTAAARGGAAGPPSAGPRATPGLTGLTAAVLLVLLAAEGLTLLQLALADHPARGHRHGPGARSSSLKMGTTGLADGPLLPGPGPYRDRGAPPLLLRLLGPVVVLLTLLVFASGIALLLVPHSLRDPVFFVHKASFVLWFGAMAIHVLGHVLETSRLAPADLVARTRRQVRGAGARLWAQAACLVVGILLAVAHGTDRRTLAGRRRARLGRLTPPGGPQWGR